MKYTLWLTPSRFRDPEYMKVVRETYPGVEVKEQKPLPTFPRGRPR